MAQHFCIAYRDILFSNTLFIHCYHDVQYPANTSRSEKRAEWKMTYGELSNNMSMLAKQREQAVL